MPPGRIVNHAETKGRAALQEDNPLEVDDPAAERVHAWLCNQLHAGYHDLASLLANHDLHHELVALQIQLCAAKVTHATYCQSL